MKCIIVLALILLTGCATRGLNENEINNLINQYSGQLKYNIVEIANKDIDSHYEFKQELEKIYAEHKVSDINVFKLRPFVINNKIFYPKKYYKEDFASYIGDDDFEWGRFVHENCHILQYQLGLTSKKHPGESYNWKLGLKEQLLSRYPYMIPGPTEIDSQDRLEDFSFEQQCQFFFYWSISEQNPTYASYGKLINDALGSQ